VLLVQMTKQIAKQTKIHKILTINQSQYLG